MDMEDVAPAKQEIACTRSFGSPVQALDELVEAVSDFSARAAQKLRGQAGVAGQVMVFIRTSPFRKTPQYSQVEAMVELRSCQSRVGFVEDCALDLDV